MFGYRGGLDGEACIGYEPVGITVQNIPLLNLFYKKHIVTIREFHL